MTSVTETLEDRGPGRSQTILFFPAHLWAEAKVGLVGLNSRFGRLWRQSCSDSSLPSLEPQRVGALGRGHGWLR